MHITTTIEEIKRELSLGNKVLNGLTKERIYGVVVDGDKIYSIDWLARRTPLTEVYFEGNTEPYGVTKE